MLTNQVERETYGLWGRRMTNLVKLTWGLRALIYKVFGMKQGTFCYIGKPLYISEKRYIHLGQRVRIYPGLRVELVESGARVEIGDNVSLGQNVHLVSCGEKLKIGRDVTISGNVFITNCDHEYREIGKSILDQPLIKKHTEIGDQCFIGYGAVLQAGSVLGRQCIVGANSVVRGNFSDNSVIVGNPAIIVRCYNPKTAIWEKQPKDCEGSL
jgi:acetyltransferase-like isoleucine patch superfamily enzyme